MSPGSPFADLAAQYPEGHPARNFADAAEMWASVVTPNPQMMEVFQGFVVLGLRLTDYAEECQDRNEAASIANAIRSVCNGVVQHVEEKLR
jgi:hypothetical protein